MTLRLADEDAAVIASILNRVAEKPGERNSGNAYEGWFLNVRHAHAGRDLDKIKELAGAFQVAVRANRR